MDLIPSNKVIEGKEDLRPGGGREGAKIHDRLNQRSVGVWEVGSTWREWVEEGY